MHAIPFDLEHTTDNLNTDCKLSLPVADRITFMYTSLSNYKFHNYTKFDARGGRFSEWVDILE
jgi:hypothetical protein